MKKTGPNTLLTLFINSERCAVVNTCVVYAATNGSIGISKVWHREYSYSSKRFFGLETCSIQIQHHNAGNLWMRASDIQFILSGTICSMYFNCKRQSNYHEEQCKEMLDLHRHHSSYISIVCTMHICVGINEFRSSDTSIQQGPINRCSTLHRTQALCHNIQLMFRIKMSMQNYIHTQHRDYKINFLQYNYMHVLRSLALVKLFHTTHGNATIRHMKADLGLTTIAMWKKYEQIRQKTTVGHIRRHYEAFLMRRKCVCTKFKDRDISPDIIKVLYSEMHSHQIFSTAQVLKNSSFGMLSWAWENI